IQAYAATHHNHLPTPALVKHILTSTATNIGAPPEQQGAGLLNIAGAVALARSIAGTTVSNRPGGLLANRSQLDLSGLPHQRLTGSVRLTNTGTSPVTVYPHARQLARFGAVSGSVTLDPSNGTSQPKFPIWSGALEI